MLLLNVDVQGLTLVRRIYVRDSDLRPGNIPVTGRGGL
jgi:hypothetical protein